MNLSKLTERKNQLEAFRKEIADLEGQIKSQREEISRQRDLCEQSLDRKHREALEAAEGKLALLEHSHNQRRNMLSDVEGRFLNHPEVWSEISVALKGLLKQKEAEILSARKAYLTALGEMVGAGFTHQDLNSCFQDLESTRIKHAVTSGASKVRQTMTSADVVRNQVHLAELAANGKFSADNPNALLQSALSYLT